MSIGEFQAFAALFVAWVGSLVGVYVSQWKKTDANARGLRSLRGVVEENHEEFREYRDRSDSRYESLRSLVARTREEVSALRERVNFGRQEGA